MCPRDRDREVDRDRHLVADAGRLIRRIKLAGNALGMTLDRIAVEAVCRAGQLPTRSPSSTPRPIRVTARIDARAPEGMLPRKYTGAATSAVTLSPDGETLYAVNSGSNSIAVIPLERTESEGRERLDPDRVRAA